MGEPNRTGKPWRNSAGEIFDPQIALTSVEELLHYEKLYREAGRLFLPAVVVGSPAAFHELACHEATILERVWLQATGPTARVDEGDGGPEGNQATVSPAVVRGEDEQGQTNARPRKEPSKDAMTVYRYWFASSCVLSDRKTQTQLAQDPELMGLLGRKVDQGTISRYLKEVREWIKAGNILPDLAELLGSKPTPMDSERIDLGPNPEHRPKHLRKRGTSDSDG